MVEAAHQAAEAAVVHQAAEAVLLVALHLLKPQVHPQVQARQAKVQVPQVVVKVMGRSDQQLAPHPAPRLPRLRIVHTIRTGDSTGTITTFTLRLY